MITVTRSLRTPLSWNRYAYAIGNPLKHVDPTGEVFILSACKDDTSADSCKQQLALVQDALGEAGKHISVGKGGVVNVTGVSLADFKSLGTLERGIGELIGAKQNFTLFTGESPYVSESNPANTAPVRNWLGLRTGDVRIDILTSAFPTRIGGVMQTTSTALAHETGHAVSNLFGDLANRINQQAISSRYLYRGEGYPMTFENRYRAERGLQERKYYLNPGDYNNPGKVSLFP